ncbi:phage virion morphogenesis (putative tail completion) protein [Fontimonas thermophila]|uniref:Phage virion morphogenesis (Putative tail completion) protein n=1 Tax=Fontimonas thermophila TaxID=1076937 RepID=A0A1I2HD02_9GAMM|nr:phage virion morphogenesis protein [Fontimonas thermophila]SFF27449.1 phage virion morphogenesis (putative tail completion) protein [Fontimonas thermophila]
MITLTLDDRDVQQALARLQARVSDMTPVMQQIGDALLDRTRQRFVTSTAPDGTPWQPNAPATIAAYLKPYGGMRRKDGSLSKRGAARAAAKKPLIGETRTLSRQFYVRADRHSVVLASTAPYAAIHQFGGRAGRGRKVTIPARPFLPVAASGGWLGTGDRDVVLAILRAATRITAPAAVAGLTDVGTAAIPLAGTTPSRCFNEAAANSPRK